MEADVFVSVKYEELVAVIEVKGVVRPVDEEAVEGEAVLEMEDRLGEIMVGLVLLLYSDSRLPCLLAESGCTKDCFA